MGLVANYGSSGDEMSDEEEDIPQKNPSSSGVSNNLSKKVISTTIQQKSHETTSSSSDDDGEEGASTSTIGQFLPKPKTAVDFPAEVELENGPIPPKKTYGDEERPPPPSSFPNLVTKKVKGVVRIAAPSLKDFENDAADDKSKSGKFVQSMIKKGSGLFAILPEPRGGNLSREMPMSFLKTKVPTPAHTDTTISAPSQSPSPSSTSKPILPQSLIPDSVKNLGKRPTPSKLDEIRAKYLKQDANVVIVSNRSSSTGTKSTEGIPSTSTKRKQDSDDSDDESAPNFFSFDSGTNEMDEETLERLKLPMPDFSQLPSSSSSTVRKDEHEDDEDIATSSQAVHQQDFMKYVPRKKGKGGKEEINFIDVKQDDLRPDSTEWVKNITDDSAVPVRRGKGLGGMQKRKHQITYLAVEAKAREQELQQQWAAGRANRRQTKMKYGF